MQLLLASTNKSAGLALWGLDDETIFIKTLIFVKIQRCSVF